MSEIILYKDAEKQIQVEVNLDGETVWLSQKQMAKLFGKDTDTVGLHLKNIFSEKELNEKTTTEFFSVVRKEGKRDVSRKIKYYNLDAILSVGYRVNSKRGTLFRQWATARLKDYLIKGYALNEKRLQQVSQNLRQLETVVNQIQLIGNSQQLQLTEVKGLLEILSNYTKSFVLLNQFDGNKLVSEKLNENITYEIQYREAKAAIAELKKQLIKKKEATDLFGNEKDESFKSSLQSIVQTFGGQYLYPSIEEQAANLLYFVIKNHSFSDGNKRIGAFLFIWFLEKNKHRFKKSGEVKINDNGLTALALLVAQSNPEEKELMIKLVINLING